MSATFLPSEVDLEASFPPLVGTFRRTEAEVMAAWLVRTCALGGDAWRPLAFADVKAQMKADVEGEVSPWGELARNPFAHPDPHGLVEHGFAEWVGEEPDVQLQFTEQGFEALRKWVRPQAQNATVQ